MTTFVRTSLTTDTTQREGTTVTNSPYPIQVDREEAIFDPDGMVAGRFYKFSFLGHGWYAMKKADESIECFYVAEDQ
jgi:hypothetical protein